MRSAAALTALAVAVLPACGEDDDEASAAPQPSEASDAPQVEAVAHGITEDTIEVGIGWIDAAALAAAFAPDLDPGDHSTQEQIQAVIDWMNANGGIAGRTIVAHYHEFPISDLLDPAAGERREQATCDAFTQDDEVYAAVPVVSASGIFNTCAAERDVITIEVTNTGENVDAARFAEIGHRWYRPSWITGERREQVVAAELERRGFLDDARDSLGLLVEDSPLGRRMGDVMTAELEKAGVTPAEIVRYGAGEGAASTVLRFSSAGITHVLWSGCTACGGITQSSFMLAAESQGYQPTYALSSDLAILNLTKLGAPPAQLTRTVAIGWNPEFDGVREPNTPPADAPISPGDRDCRAAAEAAHIPFPYGMYCEGLFFLKHALEAADELSPDGFRRAVEELGSSYPAVTTFATAFGEDRHDGAAAVRDLVFEASCTCWAYEGGVTSTTA